METGQSKRQTPVQEQLTQWWKHHPYLLGPGWVIIWLIAKARGSLAVVFATWPSMHDPISNLLNAADAEEADKLTEKWTDAKLKELNYVGISSALITGTIASAFSWYSVQDDPWSTEACWTSALVLALTAISLATQQTIGLSRLCSGDDGWLKVRRLLGEADPCDDCRRRPGKKSGAHSPRRHAGARVRMKKRQLWIWQTPVMLSNFAILLFVVGLMISMFVRAVRSRRDWTSGDLQIAIFFGAASVFAGSNYLFCWLCLNQGSLESVSQSDRSGNPETVF